MRRRLHFYLTPTIIANNRHHPQSVAIFALNILLGWSMLGWVAAFVWSLTTERGYGSVLVTPSNGCTPTRPRQSLPPAIVSGSGVGSWRG